MSFNDLARFMNGLRRASPIDPAWVPMSCSWILLAVSCLASTSQIYVVNGAGDTVDVIDPAADRVVQRIEGMEGAFATAFSPDGGRVYVSNEFKDLIYVVDRRSGKILKKIPASGHPSMMAMSRDGSRIFVNLQSKFPQSGIDIIDTVTLKRVETIATKAPMHDIYLTQDGKYLVSASDIGQFLVVIDAQTRQPCWTVSFDQRVYTLAVEGRPDGSPNRIFVQLRGLNGFAVVDFNQHRTVGTVNLPTEPSGFLAGFRNPSHGIGIAPDGKTLWVNSGEANSVFVYALPELTVIGHVALPVRSLPGNHRLGSQPNWLTFTGDGRKVYVSNTWLNSVSAIDAATMNIVSTIAVGQLPRIVDTLTVP